MTFSDRIQNHEHMIKRVHLYSKNRPVYGILTEPLRGDISKGDANLDHMKEYIPASHVQFLEQSSIKVVPISYQLSAEDLLQ